MTSAQITSKQAMETRGLTRAVWEPLPSPFYTKEVEEFCNKICVSGNRGCDESRRKAPGGRHLLWTDADRGRAESPGIQCKISGDPEAQVVLPRMKNDIIEVVEACIDGTLDQVDLEFEDNAAVCVVLPAMDIRWSTRRDFRFQGLEEFKKKGSGYYCFHAGTKFDGGQIVTNGGRVLGVTAKGKDLKSKRKCLCGDAVGAVLEKQKQVRHDIGKAIDEA